MHMWTHFGKLISPFFFKHTTVNPIFSYVLFFCSYITIASSSMATFRSEHLEKDTIAMVPVHGYVNNTNFSHEAIRWLDYVALKEGISIQHALNNKGECKVEGISVDGYCEETKTIYQFHVRKLILLSPYVERISVNISKLNK